VEDLAVRSVLGAIVFLGLGLTLGVASPRSAPQARRALSFKPTAGVVATASKASVLVDTGDGRFLRVKPPGTGKPRIALADAIGDVNGDGRPDLVTHYSDDQNDTCSESDGVEVCSSYAYVSLHKRNGTFGGGRVVWTSDTSDVAASAIADVNGDGKPDVVLATVNAFDGTGSLVVLAERGNGKFRRVKPSLGTGGEATDSITGETVAVAAVDVNGDGRRDLVAAGAKVSVFLNLGGGRFAPRRSYRVGPGVTALTARDLNRDGRPDLAVARNATEGRVTVLLNRGGGSFGARHDYAVGNGPVSVAIGDLNGDRRPDLATANFDTATASVLLNRGGGRFGARLDYATSRAPRAIAVGRFNRDGRRDLVVPTFNGIGGDAVTVLVETPGLCDVQDVWSRPLATASRTLQLSGCKIGTVSHASSTGFSRGHVIAQSQAPGAVLPGGSVDLTVSDGPGPKKLRPFPTFKAPKSYPLPKGGKAVAVADLNGDGAPDVVTGNCGNTVSVLLNMGHGALAPRQDYRVAECSDAVKLADLNGDGRPDIVSSGDDGDVSVLLNQGDGTFGPRHNYVAESGPTYGTDYVAVVDVDGDGKPDLAVLNNFEAAHGLTVYFGNGDGTFGSPRNYDIAGDAEAVVAADLNGDGKLDLPSLGLGGIVEIVNAGGGTLEQTRSYDAGGDGSTIFAGKLTGGANADLVVTYPDAGTVQVFLNEGDGALRPYTAYRAPGESVAIGDLNGDGTLDLAVSGKTVSIVRNRGNGTFTARRQYSTGAKSPRAVAIGDLNGDGKPDLVTANGTTVVVLIAR
jgi:hypothetical protein